MESRVLKFIDCYEELKKSIPIFTEAFVAYYGEEYRAEIEEKFSRAIFIGYQDPEYIKTSVINLEKEKTEELLSPLIEKLGLDLTIRDLINSNSLNFPNGHPIKNTIDFYRLHKIGPEGRKEAFIIEGYKEFKKNYPETSEEEYREIFRTKKLPESFDSLPENTKFNISYYLDEKNIDGEYKETFHKAKTLINSIIPNTTINNFREKENSEEYKKMHLLIKGYLDALDEYQKFKEEHKDLYAEEERVTKRRQLLDDKYHEKFIRENLDLLPEQIKEEVLKELNKESGHKYFGAFANKIFGSLMISPSIIEAFQEENNDFFKLTDWQREETIRKRIEFFKGFGIDYGDDYSKYIDDEEVKRIWPSSDRIAAFIESRNKYLNAFYEELYTQSPQHKRIREEIDSVHLLDKDDSFDASAYLTKLTAVNPNIIRTEHGYELFSLLLVNFNRLDSDSVDHFIVHELNHLFELKLQEVFGNDYSFICGWDNYTGIFGQDERRESDVFKKESKRNYELFNEIINELIAQEISEIMHQKGMYIFDNKGKSKIRNTTSYDHYRVLVSNFFNEFKDVIIASRRGNIDLLFDTVGKENFEELNNLFHDFYEHFCGMKIYKALGPDPDPEAKKVYDELIMRSDEVFKKMKKNRDAKKERNLAI